MEKTTLRLIRKDGILIEKVVDNSLPIISVVSSRRIGPWSLTDPPFCQVTLTAQVFEKRLNGSYAELSEEKFLVGMEDIYPDRQMCREFGQNPRSETSTVEEEILRDIIEGVRGSGNKGTD